MGRNPWKVICGHVFFFSLWYQLKGKCEILEKETKQHTHTLLITPFSVQSLHSISLIDCDWGVKKISSNFVKLASETGRDMTIIMSDHLVVVPCGVFEISLRGNKTMNWVWAVNTEWLPSNRFESSLDHKLSLTRLDNSQPRLSSYITKYSSLSGTHCHPQPIPRALQTTLTVKLTFTGHIAACISRTSFQTSIRTGVMSCHQPIISLHQLSFNHLSHSEVSKT